MGRLIEEQAVIDCLTNTAKYYEREDADEWTKGIHYGLLHGLDNILDDVSPVEAIPKDQYEARLKADMVAMLTDIQIQFEEKSCKDMRDCWWLIEEKINALKEDRE
jgi:hypothetical protein